MLGSRVNPKIQLTLSDPGMTFLHRAGIAGFWMTLKQLEELYPNFSERPGDLTWSLTDRSISLYWKGEDFKVLDWLLKKSFQISNEGLISLTGLSSLSMDIETQIAIHQGITETFLQHNSFFKSSGKASRSLTIDGKELVVKYKKAASYAQQNFSQHLCDEQGQLLEQPIGIRGWLYPGAVVSHYALVKQTKFEETPQRALGLLFAPVACLYFMVPPLFSNEQAQYVLVIPEVNNLELYREHRWELRTFGYKNFYASNLADAGLKFLSKVIVKESAKSNKFKQCKVILFEKTDWSKPQRNRTKILLIKATEKVEHHYKITCKYFPEYRVIKYKNKNFIIPSLARSIITDNLARCLPWWLNFYTTIKNNNLFQQITYEQIGFYNMIQNYEWDIQSQKLFIQVCHEALKKIYAKIYGRTKKEEYAQIERENTRIFSQLKRCTNAEHFRKFITELWGRAGKLSSLEKNWEEILPLTTGMTDWQLGRDLTLIALASYPKSKKDEDRLKDKVDDRQDEHSGKNDAE